MSRSLPLAARRAPWLGRFPRIVSRGITLHLVICILAAITLFITIDSVEAANRALSRTTVEDLLRLQLYNIPNVVQQFATLCALIGTSTALGGLVRRGEIVAAFSAGGSPALILKPAVAVGLGVALFDAAMTEWVAPVAHAEVGAARRRLGLPALPNELLSSSRAWFRGESLIYRVQELEDPTGAVLGRVLILRLEGGRLVDRWDVDRLMFHDGQWIAEGIVRRAFDPRDRLSTERTRAAPIDLRERPDDFVRSIGAPERLPFEALRETTRARERLGQSTVAHRIELYRRLAHPVCLWVAVVLSAAAALHLGRRPSLARSLSSGALLGFLLWFVDEVALALGARGAIPAFASAHSALGVAAAGAILGWTSLLRNGLREGEA